MLRELWCCGGLCFAVYCVCKGFVDAQNLVGCGAVAICIVRRFFFMVCVASGRVRFRGASGYVVVLLGRR